MIVYIDGMDFRRTGIGRVLENVLVGLIESEKITKVQTLIPRTRRKEFLESFSDHPKIDAAFAAFEPFSPRDFLLKQRLIDRFSPPADVFFYPNMNIPLIQRGKVVFSINDIIMMTPQSGWSPIKRRLFRFLTAKALSRAQGVVCISNFTRGEMERVFGKSRASVRVIHPCLGEDFLYADPEKYRRSPLVDGDYILHVGIRVRHKNHAGLIRGWIEARKKFPGLRLVVVGKRLWEDDVDRLRRKYGLTDELVEFTDATDDEVKNLYSNARVFVFPSFVEGFGIPPLEAMAMGLPVVSADIPVLREVNGDSVHYVQPSDPQDIGRGIAVVLTDPGLRARLVAAGKNRLETYTHGKMAGEYVSFLRAIACTEEIPIEHRYRGKG
ncbi:MAG: glycosyltransferase family 1 protein [Candidatus Deferrimicrobiaceae bacterium]